ncbi:hypothetical protein MLD38_011501 [Melastoma candidum]|uniref:Uncharacterized protein n=1 Tax=Melastoma candidum TaxID=119954 RepID=A0ACB9R3T9_9MYRT|nr:hypothetical protein MLD38_011501 [Melastoma candidum]
MQSCLALRYEALVLRDAKSTSHHWLEVGCGEWLRFAEDAVDSGFHPIARKACDSALLCLRKIGTSDTRAVPIHNEGELADRIERLRTIALLSTSSLSVQAEAAEYLKRKNDKESQESAFSSDEYQQCASALYRESIKKRHAREFSQMRLAPENLRSPISSDYRGVTQMFHHPPLSIASGNNNSPVGHKGYSNKPCRSFPHSRSPLPWPRPGGGIPRRHSCGVWTASAMVFSAFLHFDLLEKNYHFPNDSSGIASEELPTETNPKVLRRAFECVSLSSKSQYLQFTIVYELEVMEMEAVKSKFAFPVISLLVQPSHT